MSHSPLELATGAAVLALAVGFGAYMVQSTGLSFSQSGYELHASFRSVEGVGVGTDVRPAGVKVGTLSAVALNTQTYRADTVMHINEGIEIPDDSAVVIASEGLLGGNFVEISPGGSMFSLEPGDEIIDTQGSVSLLSLLLQFVSGEKRE